MHAKVARTYIFFIIVLLSLHPAKAQQSLTWDNFCEEYFFADDENIASAEEQMEILEGYISNPLNLNIVNRNDLLQLPFLSEAQIDSIISFRERKHGFISIGDLMFIQNISFRERNYLSLFVFVGENERKKLSLKQQLFAGRHEVETRLDIPLYTRYGQRDIPEETLLKYPNRKYLRQYNAIRITIRIAFQQLEIGLSPLIKLRLMGLVVFPQNLRINLLVARDFVRFNVICKSSFSLFIHYSQGKSSSPYIRQKYNTTWAQTQRLQPHHSC